MNINGINGLGTYSSLNRANMQNVTFGRQNHIIKSDSKEVQNKDIRSKIAELVEYASSLVAIAFAITGIATSYSPDIDSQQKAQISNACTGGAIFSLLASNGLASSRRHEEMQYQFDDANNTLKITQAELKKLQKELEALKNGEKVEA